MSDRLTSKWTNTAEEAFGRSGQLGRTGELFAINRLREQLIPATDTENDRHLQVSGVDIVTPGCTVDVKSNLKRGRFFVETGLRGWLFHPSKTSDVIIHVDVSTGECAWYYRSHLSKVIRPQPISASNSSSGLVPLTHTSRPDIISNSWDDFFAACRG